MRYGHLPYPYIATFVALPYLLGIYPIYKAISDSAPFNVTKDVSDFQLFVLIENFEIFDNINERDRLVYL